MLYCDPSLIEAQPKGNFAAYVRGVTRSALPLQFPFGHMEAMDRMTADERNALRQAMRDRYAVHYSEITEISESGEPGDSGDDTPPERPRDPDDLDTDAASEWHE